ncbi:four helix bundle protein [Candidatus Parcubacteria bacterium]|nr:four helix bundle protein [Patescibacteria group bacterium]MBU4481951.1 four helix bundle protein [Patescibacteria group bacterium]MCG2687045.1 four helix bundle protein [Candidatus Parcubacteria bacterium]
MDYNLEPRTKEFSKQVLELLSKVKINEINRNIIYQLSKSATSVGANYREANAASSKKDFINKISICRKEIQETEYWIELLAKTDQKYIDKLRKLWKEAHELTLIFGKIYSSLKDKSIKK